MWYSIILPKEEYMVTYLRSVFDLWERVSSVSDLSSELKKYRNVLSLDLYRYLESLLERGSVLNDNEFYSACYGCDRNEGTGSKKFSILC